MPRQPANLTANLLESNTMARSVLGRVMLGVKVKSEQAAALEEIAAVIQITEDYMARAKEEAKKAP